MYDFLRPGIACMGWENCPTQNCKACNCKQSETCKECYAETVKRLVPAVEEKDVQKTTTVNHPDYYQKNGIETIDIIKAVTENLIGIEAFCVGNAIKYISRFKGKGGSEDIEKAVWYLQYLQKLLREEAQKDQFREVTKMVKGE